jgi:hypothetical protein
MDDDWGPITAERMAASAAVVLRDLFGDEPPPIAVRFVPPDADDPEMCAFEVIAADGESFGWTLPAETSDEELRHTLAERIPEYAPELTVTWARALPPCPRHVHPAALHWEPETQQSWWTCPDDGRRLARVGELHDAR